MDRNALLDALRDRLKEMQGTLGVRTVSRRLKVPPALGPGEQPAIFIPDPEGQDAEHRGRGLPPIWRLSVTLFVFVHNADTEGPSPKLQRILDEIETVLRRRDGEPRLNDEMRGTNLGGLCWGVQVVSVRATADLERHVVDQAVALVELEIMVPG